MFSKKEDKKPAVETAKAPGTTAAAKVSAPAAAPATNSAQQRPPVTLRYVDRPELVETFADSIGHLSFDGQSLRIEFAVTRMDDVKQDAPLTGRRYPACRLVLPPQAAVELINRMQQIAAALTQAGVLRHNAPAPAPTAPGGDPKTRN